MRTRRVLPGVAAAVVGACLLAVGVFAPDSVVAAHRTLVLSFGGVAVVAGVLDVLLSPGGATPPAVAGALHAARTADAAATVGTAGLSERRWYLPGGDDAVLYVPETGDEPAPDDAVAARDAPGATFDAVGRHLIAELDTGALDGSPDVVGARLADAAAERFELAEEVRVVEATETTLTVLAEGAGAGDPGGFDHPIVGLLGVGVAFAVDEPVDAAVRGNDGGATVVELDWE